MEPFLAQILMFGGNFAPRGWALCNGQLLPISQYSALFSILGTTYGGDGRTTFALPDLRGRAPIHVGNGPGLRSVRQGERFGAESVTLTAQNLPPAKVSIPASSDDADGDDPADAGCAVTSSDSYGTPQNGTSMAKGTIEGRNIPFSIISPSLGVNYIIALTGVFPSRS